MTLVEEQVVDLEEVSQPYIFEERQGGVPV